MKKLITLLLILPFIFSCSDDKDETQDYTSFVVSIQNTVSDDLVLTNCVAAYKKDNKYYKISNLGDLSKHKQSSEIIVKDNSITEIYIFTDYNNVIRFDIIFELKSNKKNMLEIPRETKGIPIADKTDPTQYPQ